MCLLGFNQGRHRLCSGSVRPRFDPGLTFLWGGEIAQRGACVLGGGSKMMLLLPVSTHLPNTFTLHALLFPSPLNPAFHQNALNPPHPHPKNPKPQTLLLAVTRKRFEEALGSLQQLTAGKHIYMGGWGYRWKGE